MCQKCLLTAQTHATYADAALKLALAAKHLNDINSTSNSNVLASAAADMFRAVEPFKPASAEAGTRDTFAPKGDPVKGEASGGEAGHPVPPHVPAKGIYVDNDTSLLYVNGSLVGRVVTRL